MRNKSDPKTDPWRTPLLTSDQPETDPLIITLCCLLFSQDSIHEAILPSMPLTLQLIGNEAPCRRPSGSQGIKHQLDNPCQYNQLQFLKTPTNLSSSFALM